MHVAKEISPVLSFIILIIENRIFPDVLKLSIINPLYIKDSKQDSKNYRPIALLPTFSKVI